MTIAVISMIRDAWGGSEELWYEMALEALQQQHKLVHLSYETPQQHVKIRQLIEKGMQEYMRPSYRPVAGSFLSRLRHRIGFMIRKRTDKSFQRIFDQQPDVVVYNGTCFSIGEEQKLMRHVQKSKCRFIIIGHLLDIQTMQSITTRRRAVAAYLRTDKVALLSPRLQELVEGELGFELDNVAIVKNPANIKNANPIAYPNNDKMQFAMVANLVIAHKGQDTVLNILASPKWKDRDFHLNIYGTGPDEMLLKEMTERLGLKEKVTFHGHVSDIRSVWQQNQLLLMPSHMEGVPLALVEAMLCARTAVVTDVGGNRDWMDDGIDGFIATDSSVASFEASLEKAFAKKNEWPQMGMLAHEKAKKMYDPQAGKSLLHLLTS